MEKGDVMMYLGVCIAGILTLWFARAVITDGGSLVEGLSNRDKESSLMGSKLKTILKNLDAELGLMEDMAGLSKYQDNYVEMITKMQQLCQVQVLELVANLAESSSRTNAHKKVQLINEYNTLATVTLPAAMTFVDNYSGGEGGSDDDGIF